MGWVTIRYALAHILPGMIPVLFLIHYIDGIETVAKIIGDVPSYFLAALFFGAIIELVRPIIQSNALFTKAPNPIVWIIGQYKRITKKEYVYRSLASLYNDYKKKEEAVIRFWIHQRYIKQDQGFKESVELDDMLKNQYTELPTITSGDRWAVLLILENNGLKFMVDEYFSYYQFAFNLWLSGIISGLFVFSLWLFGEINWKEIVFIFTFLVLAHFILHAVTMYWWLAISRFARKLITFYSIK